MVFFGKQGDDALIDGEEDMFTRLEVECSEQNFFSTLQTLRAGLNPVGSHLLQPQGLFPKLFVDKGGTSNTKPCAFLIALPLVQVFWLSFVKIDIIPCSMAKRSFFKRPGRV